MAIFKEPINRLIKALGLLLFAPLVWIISNQYRPLYLRGAFISGCILITLLVLVTIEDIRIKIIPDHYLVIGGLIGLLIGIVSNHIDLVNSFVGFIVGGGLIAIASYTTKGAIGMGDAKLMACIGIYLGLGRVLTLIIFAGILSGLVGLVLLFSGKVGIKSRMPFAPFVLMGTIFVLLI